MTIVKIKHWILSTALLLALWSNACADSAGTSTAGALQIGPGARATGLGEAYVAMAEDVYAAYWNPAGLARLPGSEIGLMHGRLIEDLTYDYGALALPCARGGFAISAGYFSYGDIEGFDGNDARLGNLPRSYDWQGSFSYGHAFTSRFSAGLTGRYIQKKLVTRSDSTGAADIGVQYKIGKGFTVAAMVQNIGGKLKFAKESERLPRTVKGGTAFQWRWIRLAADVQKPVDQKAFATAGLELKPIEFVALRGGYNFDDDVDDGFRLGAGLALGRETVLIDYAFLPFGLFGDTHRISLSYRWSRRT